MNDRAKERFKHKSIEMKITFRPQCISCIKNIDLNTCKEFNNKPKDYKNNTKECPKIERRD